uniref:Uncharacterized protein n=1 Tax=Branchiostoma floridae TaxID=7739 RepID=C3ZI31_BRAFL|eukprot:XP_002591762.1 hypothetical protein BRAFLDRAFT_83536 [Branchiostoma floridae]
MQTRATLIALLLCLCSAIFDVRAQSTVNTTDVTTDMTGVTTPDPTTETTAISVPRTDPPTTQPPNNASANSTMEQNTDTTTEHVSTTSNDSSVSTTDGDVITTVTTAAPVTVCSENCTYADGSSCTDGDANCTCTNICRPANPEPSGLSTAAIIDVSTVAPTVCTKVCMDPQDKPCVESDANCTCNETCSEVGKPSPQSGGLSGGEIAGVAVGAVAGVVLIGAVAAALVTCKKKKGRSVSPNSRTAMVEEGSNGEQQVDG